MSDRLTILEIRHADGAFHMDRLSASCADPGRWRHGDIFSVALVFGRLDAASSTLAFACDFVAVSAAASLHVEDGPMIRRRLGPAFDALARIVPTFEAERALALGLAVLAIDADIEVASRQVMRQAETLLALAQARRVSAPNWFDAK